MITGREIEEANTFLDMEAQAVEIEAAIERIRKPLAAGIESGAVTLAPMIDGDEVAAHPNLAVTRVVSMVDVIVSDDRFINRNPHLNEAGRRAEVWTSLELLEALCRDGQLSDADLARARYDLRRGGVVFIPPTAQELVDLLARARTQDGVLLETAELRAFRENIELAQMRGWLQWSSEIAWLDQLQKAAVAAIVAQWADDIADADARARSAWLLQRADVRNWARLDGHGDPTGLSISGLAIGLNRLLLAVPDTASAASARRLEDWLETDVIKPLQEDDPDTYAWMVARLRDLILGAASPEASPDDE